jgi:transcriptional regulator with XRE-family HTH domain
LEIIVEKFDFPRQLQLARRRAGFDSARLFAKTLAINENRYSRYERGGAEPNLELLCQICRLLGATPNQLLGFADLKTSKPPGVADDALVPFKPKRGFGEKDSQTYDPLVRASKSLIDGLMLTFCREYLEARPRTDEKTKRPAKRGEPVTITTVAALYQKLRPDPVEALLNLVTEPSYGELPQARRRALDALVEAIIDAVVPTHTGSTS